MKNLVKFMIISFLKKKQPSNEIGYCVQIQNNYFVLKT